MPAADPLAALTAAYAVDGPHLDLGRAVVDGGTHPEVAIRVPLSMMNRHGLVAGATGTGKTKTLQVMAEQLSAAGVPVLIADVKGDVSGLAAPGEATGRAADRAQELGLGDWAPTAVPCELLSLGGIGPGVPIRATVSDFGPLLLAKVLGANETQEQSLQLVFHYADEQGLALLDLDDLRALLTFLDSDAGKAELKGIGGLSSQTVGVLLRALVGLEDGGGAELFGEPQLDVADLLRTTPDGRGIVSVLELAAVQTHPQLFSTALMWLLAELFETLPEVGDLERPKLVFFFDEAHLLFTDASDAFVAAVTQTVRLIRSKGVGVFFCTQTPKDVPADVLGQLSNRVQHALRAFTPDDAKALKATVSTFPTSELYDLRELLPALGIGEAAVTVLADNGVPTPVVHAKLPPPRSRMAPADDVAGAAQASPLFAKYGTRLDPESAEEVLAQRLDAAREAAAAPPPAAPAPTPAPMEHVPHPPSRSKRPPKGGGDAVTDFLRSREGKALQRQVVRGVVGLLRKKL